MSSASPFSLLANGTAIPWAEVPEWTPAELVRATADELARGARLCSWFGVDEDEGTRLVALIAFDADNTLATARSLAARGSYPALTALQAQAHLFEREVHEQHGLVPQGHPWLKPVRASAGNAPANGAFFRVEGREVHEVAVGPVHAGIIEPGHFRFQCAGEEVLHLEIALGYQHRGVERALLGRSRRAALAQVEAIAGDSTIAHTSAHAAVLEALSGCEAPLRAQWLRALALELERLANHAGDLGALAGDVAFLPTSAACGKIRGDFLNLTALLCGNRFGRGLVRPGGSARELEPERASTLLERLRPAMAELERAAAWLWDSASVRSRFENTGVVFAPQATEIGMVGPAARACGLVRDVRYDQPAGWYRLAGIPIALWSGGDVQARARVRWLECQRSGEYLTQQLMAAPESAMFQELPGAAPETLAVALVEGWRGEVCHAALTDARGQLRRYKVTDPSFHNWSGLELALRTQAISDFPLCNKSFNLSYCGFDL